MCRRRPATTTTSTRASAPRHGAFVSDEICDRFCVIGTPEQAIAKLRELEAIGVDQFNVYLMTEGQEATLAAYGREIIPASDGGAA